MIDLVATDVLNVDLSHISGNGIVEGDKVSIRNFLEIFAGLLEYFMECVDESDAGMSLKGYNHMCIKHQNNNKAYTQAVKKLVCFTARHVTIMY